MKTSTLVLAVASLALSLSSLVSGECAEFCMMDLQPVCGSDGSTYLNECELTKRACANPSLELLKIFDGECPRPAAMANCPATCTTSYNPQCASNGITYSNACAFALGMCSNPSLTFVATGECPSKK